MPPLTFFYLFDIKGNVRSILHDSAIISANDKVEQSEVYKLQLSYLLEDVYKLQLSYLLEIDYLHLTRMKRCLKCWEHEPFHLS